VGTGGTFIVPSIPLAPRSTFGFPLSETRRRQKRFFQSALQAPGHPRPLVKALTVGLSNAHFKSLGLPSLFEEVSA